MFTTQLLKHSIVVVYLFVSFISSTVMLLFIVPNPELHTISDLQLILKKYDLNKSYLNKLSKAMPSVSEKLGLRPRFPSLVVVSYYYNCYWMPIIVRPNNTETLEFWAEKLIAGPSKENGWLVPPNPKLPQGFQQSIFKGQVREGEVTGYVMSSCTILWLVGVEVTGWLTLSILRCQKVWGLHAHDYQVVNFFHLVVVLASEKLRKYAWGSII